MGSSLVESLEKRRVGLALSGGFFGFFHHAGVLEALVELGIAPVRLTGTSAGALVASMYAAGLDPKEIRRELLSVRRSDFWDPQLPFTRRGFGLLAGYRMSAELSRVLPVHRFEDCRAPLAVGVCRLKDGRPKHISSGPLIPAVYASCALPYLFAPGELDGEPFVDGGAVEKTPLVPFLDEPKVDTVVVSYIPGRSSERLPGRGGLLSFLPGVQSLLMRAPAEELKERDRVSIELLKKAGMQVLVLAPKGVRLGPFSLYRAAEAVETGKKGALRLLEAGDEAQLGWPVA